MQFTLYPTKSGFPIGANFINILKGHLLFTFVMMDVWKDRVLAILAKARWLHRCCTNLCAILTIPSFFVPSLFIQLVLKVKQQVDSSLLLGVSWKASMMFNQKNIPGHSMMFHGDYIKSVY